MNLDIFFRRMPPHPALHRYAYKLLSRWEIDWQRSLDLRLVFSQEADHVSLELCGRDAAGHAINGQSRGSDAFMALENLHRALGKQGQLLSPAAPPPFPMFGTPPPPPGPGEGASP